MITSTSNPAVRRLVRLRTRRHQEAEGLFIIEGRRPVARALEAGMEISRQVICPPLGGHPVDGVPVLEVAEAPFRKVSLRQAPDGILAVAPLIDTSLGHLRLPGTPLILVVESIEKPGNLGAMLRTCDALGVHALVVADPATDVHNPNVVQASQGALFTVPVGVAPAGDVRRWIAGLGASLAATVPEGGSPPWGVDLSGAVAVAVGAEDTGLSSGFLAEAEARITVPMHGRIDSLNASVAAAVVLYDAVRQRTQG